MDSGSLIFLGILAIAVGLFIIVYGVRIARLYAIISALGLAVVIGFLVGFLMMTMMRTAGNMAIPLLAALAVFILLMAWVAKAYLVYLKIYSILSIIKYGLTIIALSMLIFPNQGGVLALVVLAAVAGMVWLLVQLIVKWSHLAYMVGIMTDGALFAVIGSVMLGLSTRMMGDTIFLAALAIPMLIWAGLYRECWRQRLAFPGIQAW